MISRVPLWDKDEIPPCPYLLFVCLFPIHYTIFLSAGLVNIFCLICGFFFSPCPLFFSCPSLSECPWALLVLRAFVAFFCIASLHLSSQSCRFASFLYCTLDEMMRMGRTCWRWVLFSWDWVGRNGDLNFNVYFCICFVRLWNTWFIVQQSTTPFISPPSGVQRLRNSQQEDQRVTMIVWWRWRMFL